MNDLEIGGTQLRGFLHRHTSLERNLRDDDKHVVVDKLDYELAIDFLNANKENFKKFLLLQDINKPYQLFNR